MTASAIMSDRDVTRDRDDEVLCIENLQVCFDSEAGALIAVDGVSLSLQRGRAMGVVGESGCGKSVLGRSILRLIQTPGRITGGRIRFRPSGGAAVDVLTLKGKSEELLDLRGGRIGMIFQGPAASLSPIHTVGNQMCEAIRTHRKLSRTEARRHAAEILGEVGMACPERCMDQYAFELSGGMCQHAAIAMALASEPEILIADEPTTALDVTTQAQIMRLMKDIRRDLGTSILLITHDLGVVAQLCDDVAVMYLGRIVEQADIATVMKQPRHPYTTGLLRSLPSLTANPSRLPSIKGSVPSLTEVPPGCPFHPRCPRAEPGRCDVGGPPEMEEIGDGHSVACLRAGELGGAS